MVRCAEPDTAPHPATENVAGAPVCDEHAPSWRRAAEVLERIKLDASRHALSRRRG